MIEIGISAPLEEISCWMPQWPSIHVAPRRNFRNVAPFLVASEGWIPTSSSMQWLGLQSGRWHSSQSSELGAISIPVNFTLTAGSLLGESNRRVPPGTGAHWVQWQAVPTLAGQNVPHEVHISCTTRRHKHVCISTGLPLSMMDSPSGVLHSKCPALLMDNKYESIH